LRTDELYVKIKGDMKYMYAIIDDETPILNPADISNAIDYISKN
jgi:hypothetical protein